MRHKHGQEIASINEQLESIKKLKAGLEKSKQTLEAENADLATELRNANQSKQENDRRRKQAESQIAELQVGVAISSVHAFSLSKQNFIAFFIFACCEKGWS